MYKLALVLSTTPSFNVFRSAVTGAFSSGTFDRFMICSGFFQQRINRRGRFFASDAFTGVVLPKGSTVTVVGAYDPGNSEFDDFVQSLKRGLRSADGRPISVSQRRSVRKYVNRWHAKVFIAAEHERPRFAIIGSSNLTRSAFSPTASNNEADVLIWDDSHRETRAIATTALEAQSTAMEEGLPLPTVFVSRYDKEDSRNRNQASMSARLSTLWQDILAATN